MSTTGPPAGGQSQGGTTAATGGQGQGGTTATATPHVPKFQPKVCLSPLIGSAAYTWDDLGRFHFVTVDPVGASAGESLSEASGT